MGLLQNITKKGGQPQAIENLDRIVVGLGNPGPRYASTRHNAGFWVADEIALKLGAEPWKEGPSLLATEARRGSHQYLLIKPLTFMNKSGEAVRFCLQRLKAKPEQLVVIHDELDIAAGELRLKQGGGHGGHNGLRSIFSCIGRQDFPRIRMGIGRPTGPMETADYVLQRVPREEEGMYASAVERAAEAIVDLIDNGIDHAMNMYNRKNPQPTGKETSS